MGMSYERTSEIFTAVWQSAGDCQGWALDRFLAVASEALDSYADTMMWCVPDESGECSADELDNDLWHEAAENVAEFLLAAGSDDIEEWASVFGPWDVGHCLWLTSDRHGAGFWDRGAGGLGDRLTDIAHNFQIYVYAGDDGTLYQS